MAKKRNIFLVGLMGVGKTSIGKLLAKELDLTFYDSDQAIEKRTGTSISWIFDLEGETGFRRREAKIIEELTKLENVVLATGGGVVLNPHNRQLLKERGTVIYLRATLEDLLIRTSYQQSRPLLLNGNPKEVLQKLLLQREPLYQEVADIIYDTSSSNAIEVTKNIIDELRKRGQFKNR